jgi:hypothetical protein
MKLFDRYRLEKEGPTYALVLYLNKFHTEFSDELGHLKTSKEEELNKSVQEYVKENFSHLPVNKVNVVMGSLVISTLNL